VNDVRAGTTVPLDPRQAHHLRHVLRLADGAAVEVFDDAGHIGRAILLDRDGRAFVRIDRAEAARPAANLQLTIVSAVPKGERADWMVEKLSELGVSVWVPLAASRSVVLPEGKSKRDRWTRIATEAARQSRRAGVMRITELTDLPAALRGAPAAWFLSTEEANASPVAPAAASLPSGSGLTAFIGPEGGWTETERRRFIDAGATPVRLTDTTLRIETAAVATAAVVLTVGGPATLDARARHDDDPPSTPNRDPA
jgi:16S rRNA (uracil1498-N3)-methyltransferase